MVRAFLKRFSRATHNEHVVLSVLAVLVGIMASYGEFLFVWTMQTIQAWAFAPGVLEVIASDLPWWQVVSVPTVGGLLVGILAVFVLPGRQPQGVADVIEANALRNGRMRARDGAGAALLSVLSLGAGASVGREGPIVHMGATLGSRVARRLRLGMGDGRTLLGCGVAAAVAAAFNAPIAGVFFALEVVVGHYALRAFSPVVVASVTGTVISRALHGDNLAFDLPPQSVVSLLEFPAFVLLGFICGGAAMALMRLIALVEAAHEKVGIPLWVRPALAGFLLGLLALAVPQVLGIGYATTVETLLGSFEPQHIILIVIAKVLATALCLGSRFGGGIFSPSLVLGALIGVSFDGVAEMIFPALSSDTALYGMLGMGAFAGATLGAPISTILMVFELTQDYGITFALMVCVSIASLFCRVVYGQSFFTWQLAKRGISLSAETMEMVLLSRRTVADIQRTSIVTAPADADLETLKGHFRRTHLPIFVVDDEQHLLGQIEVDDLADAAFVVPGEEAAAPLAQDLVRPVDVVFAPTDRLDRAWRRVRGTDEEYIPVVETTANKRERVVGVVRLRDLIVAYNRALLEARALERGDA